MKKIGHIILSILLVVSTTGLSYTKHFCSAQSFKEQHTTKKTHSQKAHAHNFTKQKQDITHAHSNKHSHTNKIYSNSHDHQDDLCSSTQECTNDEPCCENETCSDDNCCTNKVITIKLSLNYIIIDSKEIFKTFELDVFNSSIITSFNSLFKESNPQFKEFLITDAPNKIKNTPSILQNFRC